MYLLEYTTWVWSMSRDSIHIDTSSPFASLFFIYSMDPLGARPTITTPDDIQRWGKGQTIQDPLSQSPSLLGPRADLPKVHKSPPFGIRDDLNDKVALW